LQVCDAYSQQDFPGSHIRTQKKHTILYQLKTLMEEAANFISQL
jgi:hypothetical protein